MKAHLLALALVICCGEIYPCSYLEIPRREIVRSSAVVALAKVTAVNGQVGQRVAHFTIGEILKGTLAKTFLDVPFIEKAEGPCGGTVNYDLGSEYILFLTRKANSDEFGYPGYLRVSGTMTVENMRRFVTIAETDDMGKWRTPYLEIFQSGEYEFFMEAYKALINLGADKHILEKGLLDEWTRLSGEEWKRTYLVGPLVDLKSRAAIVPLKEMAQHGSSWNFRIDAMKALIALEAENLQSLFLEISRTDKDASVRRAAFENIGMVTGKTSGEYLFDAISHENDPWTRAELLRLLAGINHPATYDLAQKALASRDDIEKAAACVAFSQLRDTRAYPLLLKGFDSATMLYKSELMDALIAIDDDAASLFLTSRIYGASSLDVVHSLGNSKSAMSFNALSQTLASELFQVKATNDLEALDKHISLINAISESLIRIDPIGARAIVLPLAKHPNLDIRYATISMLGTMKVPWAFETLIEILSEPDIASCASDALLKIDYEKASPVILQLVREDKLPLTGDLREIFVQHKEQRSIAILEKALREAEDGYPRSILQDAIMAIRSGTQNRQSK